MAVWDSHALYKVRKSVVLISYFICQSVWRQAVGQLSLREKSKTSIQCLDCEHVRVNAHMLTKYRSVIISSTPTVRAHTGAADRAAACSDSTAPALSHRHTVASCGTMCDPEVTTGQPTQAVSHPNTFKTDCRGIKIGFWMKFRFL